MFEPLRYRSYAIYFAGQTVSLMGTWIQNLAMSWLVFRLTGSVALLGVTAALGQIPMAMGVPFAGVVADRFDKRKLLILVLTVQTFHAGLIAGLALAGVLQIWMILLLSFSTGVVEAFRMPAQVSFAPRLVPREFLAQAVALNSANFNFSRLIGPLVAGILIPVIGEAGCFLVNAFSFLFVIFSLSVIRAIQPEKPSRHSMIEGLLEGLRYVRKHSAVGWTLAVAFMNSFCGMSLGNFLPAFAKDSLGGTSATFSYLVAAIGVGALLASLCLSAIGGRKHHSRLIIGAMVCTSLACASIFHLQNLAAALPICFVFGFCLVTTQAGSNIALQIFVPTEISGRMLGYFGLCFIGGGSLGSLCWGLLGQAVSIQFAFGTSGAILLAFTALYAKCATTKSH